LDAQMESGRFQKKRKEKKKHVRLDLEYRSSSFFMFACT
jgi:hypothetical protein